MGPLLALLAGGKGKAMGKSDMPMGKSDMPMDDSGADDKPEEGFARDAFQAVKDDDEQGFVDAFIGAVKACSASYSNDASEPDQDDAG